MKENGLKTGTFGNGNVIVDYVKDILSKDPNSHGQMNLDKNKGAGAISYNNKGATMYDAAKAVAQKELNRTVNNNNDN